MTGIVGYIVDMNSELCISKSDSFDIKKNISLKYQLLPIYSRSNIMGVTLVRS